jgi:uncharacterized protein
VSVAERVQVMDVLRGVALFGVFLMNLTAFATAPIMATEEQLLSLPTAAWDFTLMQVLRWLFMDKANTMFAFLFGLGFYLQMQRLEARDVDFGRLFLRRMSVLLILGVAHLLFVWTWDILHLYALAGFILFAMRRLPTRDLLGLGILLALTGRAAQKALAEFDPGGHWTSQPVGFSDADVLLRQRLAREGDYPGMVTNFFDWAAVDYLASGLIIGWLTYVLGRFLLGAWVGRHGWIERAGELLAGWRRVRDVALLVGLVMEGVGILFRYGTWLPVWPHREFIGECIHLVGTPVLAAGYVAAVVVGFEGGRWRRWLAPFAWVGRMALTNYLTQSLVIGFVLFGVGPGLALAGRIGTVSLLAIVVVGFTLQVLLSRWWLGRFRHGPAEWLWRRLTYGELAKSSEARS